MPNRNGPGARANAHGAGTRYVGQQSFTRAGRTLYLPSRIKRHRATKADVEQRRNSLLAIVKAIEQHLPPDQFKVLKVAEASERRLIRDLVGAIKDAQ